MTTSEEILAIALQHHQAGQHAQAQQLYEQILSSNPQHVSALHMSGILAMQSGQTQLAIERLRKAVAADSSQPEFHANLGLVLLNDGQIDAAIACLQRALEQHPNSVNLYEQLGNALIGNEQWDAAAEAYERVTELAPDYVEGHNNLGNIYKVLKNIDDAVHCYERALALAPDFAAIRHNLGNTLAEQGNMEAAIGAYQKVLEVDPKHVETHQNLAAALVRQGLFESAAASYRQAIQLCPDHVEDYYNLGNTWIKLKEYEAALECYQQAIRLRPDYAEAHGNLAATYQEIGQHDAALMSYHRVLQLRPDDARAYCNIGNILRIQGKYEAAISFYQQSIRLNPESVEAHYHQGSAHQSIGDLDEAIVSFQRAIRLHPEHVESHFCLGNCYKEKNQHSRSLECYERAWQLSPDSRLILAAVVNQRQHLCRWDELDELSDRLIQMLDQQVQYDSNEIIHPFPVLSLCRTTTPAQQLQAALEYVRRQPGLSSANRSVLFRQSPRRQCSKIRVGYLSADFQAHPVGYLTPELFESHDRERFQVFGYSLGIDDGSGVRRRLEKAFDQFRDLGARSFHEAAEQIRKDGIDILIDLQGYTTHSRPQIVALRPAPIQVNYLGYAASMGADFIDYILVDDYLVPTDQQPFYAERLVHLPGCFMVNDSRREIDSKIPLRYKLGLPEDGFVFCAFNTNYKLTARMFDVWLRLLQATPRSVLWLRDSIQSAVEQLKGIAERYGVSSDRLVMAPSVSMPEHLARHRAADLFLDTFPYNQHSTASDALRMGLPMVTLSGETFASRVAGSLLRTLDLTELITRSFEEYESLALRLAHNPDELSSIRRKLARNVKQSKLYDGRAFAKNVEQAYQRMWELHVSGLPPQPLVISNCE